MWVESWNTPSGHFPKAFDFKRLSIFWFYYLASCSFTKNVLHAGWFHCCLVMIGGGVVWENQKEHVFNAFQFICEFQLVSEAFVLLIMFHSWNVLSRCLYYLVFFFHLSFFSQNWRIKLCCCLLLIFCLSHSASLVVSEFTGIQSPSKFIFTEGLNPKLT